MAKLINLAARRKGDAFDAHIQWQLEHPLIINTI
jgi:hypothetical protein